MHCPEKSSSQVVDVKIQESRYKRHIINLQNSKACIDVSHPPPAPHLEKAQLFAQSNREKAQKKSEKLYAIIPKRLDYDLMSYGDIYTGNKEEIIRKKFGKNSKINTKGQIDPTCAKKLTRAEDYAITTKKNWMEDIKRLARYGEQHQNLYQDISSFTVNGKPSQPETKLQNRVNYRYQYFNNNSVNYFIAQKDDSEDLRELEAINQKYPDPEFSSDDSFTLDKSSDEEEKIESQIDFDADDPENTLLENLIKHRSDRLKQSASTDNIENRRKTDLKYMKFNSHYRHEQKSKQKPKNGQSFAKNKPDDLIKSNNNNNSYDSSLEFTFQNESFYKFTQPPVASVPRSTFNKMQQLTEIEEEEEDIDLNENIFDKNDIQLPQLELINRNKSPTQNEKQNKTNLPKAENNLPSLPLTSKNDMKQDFDLTDSNKTEPLTKIVTGIESKLVDSIPNKSQNVIQNSPKKDPKSHLLNSNDENSPKTKVQLNKIDKNLPKKETQSNYLNSNDQSSPKKETKSNSLNSNDQNSPKKDIKSQLSNSIDQNSPKAKDQLNKIGQNSPKKESESNYLNSNDQNSPKTKVQLNKIDQNSAKKGIESNEISKKEMKQNDISPKIDKASSNEIDLNSPKKEVNSNLPEINKNSEIKSNEDNKGNLKDSLRLDISNNDNADYLFNSDDSFSYCFNEDQNNDNQSNSKQETIKFEFYSPTFPKFNTQLNNSPEKEIINQRIDKQNSNLPNITKDIRTSNIPSEANLDENSNDGHQITAKSTTNLPSKVNLYENSNETKIINNSNLENKTINPQPNPNLQNIHSNLTQIESSSTPKASLDENPTDTQSNLPPEANLKVSKESNSASKVNLNEENRNNQSVIEQSPKNELNENIKTQIKNPINEIFSALTPKSTQTQSILPSFSPATAKNDPKTKKDIKNAPQLADNSNKQENMLANMFSMINTTINSLNGSKPTTQFNSASQNQNSTSEKDLNQSQNGFDSSIDDQKNHQNDLNQSQNDLSNESTKSQFDDSIKRSPKKKRHHSGITVYSPEKAKTNYSYEQINRLPNGELYSQSDKLKKPIKTIDSNGNDLPDSETIIIRGHPPFRHQSTPSSPIINGNTIEIPQIDNKFISTLPIVETKDEDNPSYISKRIIKKKKKFKKKKGIPPKLDYKDINIEKIVYKQNLEKHNESIKISKDNVNDLNNSRNKYPNKIYLKDLLIFDNKEIDQMLIIKDEEQIEKDLKEFTNKAEEDFNQEENSPQNENSIENNQDINQVENSIDNNRDINQNENSIESNQSINQNENSVKNTQNENYKESNQNVNFIDKEKSDIKGKQKKKSPKKKRAKGKKAKAANKTEVNSQIEHLNDSTIQINEVNNDNENQLAKQTDNTLNDSDIQANENELTNQIDKTKEMTTNPTELNTQNDSITLNQSDANFVDAMNQIANNILNPIEKVENENQKQNSIEIEEEESDNDSNSIPVIVLDSNQRENKSEKISVIKEELPLDNNEIPSFIKQFSQSPRNETPRKLNNEEVSNDLPTEISISLDDVQIIQKPDKKKKKNRKSENQHKTQHDNSANDKQTNNDQKLHDQIETNPNEIDSNLINNDEIETNKAEIDKQLNDQIQSNKDEINQKLNDQIETNQDEITQKSNDQIETNQDEITQKLNDQIEPSKGETDLHDKNIVVGEIIKVENSNSIYESKIHGEDEEASSEGSKDEDSDVPLIIDDKSINETINQDQVQSNKESDQQESDIIIEFNQFSDDNKTNRNESNSFSPIKFTNSTEQSAPQNMVKAKNEVPKPEVVKKEDTKPKEFKNDRPKEIKQNDDKTKPKEFKDDDNILKDEVTSTTVNQKKTQDDATKEDEVQSNETKQNESKDDETKSKEESVKPNENQQNEPKSDINQSNDNENDKIPDTQPNQIIINGNKEPINLNNTNQEENILNNEINQNNSPSSNDTIIDISINSDDNKQSSGNEIISIDNESNPQKNFNQSNEQSPKAQLTFSSNVNVASFSPSISFEGDLSPKPFQSPKPQKSIKFVSFDSSQIFDQGDSNVKNIKSLMSPNKDQSNLSSIEPLVPVSEEDLISVEDNLYTTAYKRQYHRVISINASNPITIPPLNENHQEIIDINKSELDQKPNGNQSRDDTFDFISNQKQKRNRSVNNNNSNDQTVTFGFNMPNNVLQNSDINLSKHHHHRRRSFSSPHRSINLNDDNSKIDPKNAINDAIQVLNIRSPSNENENEKVVPFVTFGLDTNQNQKDNNINSNREDHSKPRRRRSVQIESHHSHSHRRHSLIPKATSEKEPTQSSSKNDLNVSTQSFTTDNSLITSQNDASKLEDNKKTKRRSNSLNPNHSNKEISNETQNDDKSKHGERKRSHSLSQHQHKSMPNAATSSDALSKRKRHSQHEIHIDNEPNQSNENQVNNDGQIGTKKVSLDMPNGNDTGLNLQKPTEIPQENNNRDKKKRRSKNNDLGENDKKTDLQDLNENAKRRSKDSKRDSPRDRRTHRSPHRTTNVKDGDIQIISSDFAGRQNQNEFQNVMKAFQNAPTQSNADESEISTVFLGNSANSPQSYKADMGRMIYERNQLETNSPESYGFAQLAEVNHMNRIVRNGPNQSNQSSPNNTKHRHSHREHKDDQRNDASHSRKHSRSHKKSEQNTKDDDKNESVTNIRYVD